MLRVIVAIFVFAIVAVAVLSDRYFLAIAGIWVGMILLISAGIIFIILALSKAKMKTDERGATVQEKAARITFTIFAPTIGIAAFLLLFPSQSGLSAFSSGNWLYLESLGMIFAYLTLFLIVIYAISYYFCNRKYGGGGNVMKDKNEN
jgi:hypothetical protein